MFVNTRYVIVPTRVMADIALLQLSFNIGNFYKFISKNSSALSLDMITFILFFTIGINAGFAPK